MTDIGTTITISMRESFNRGVEAAAKMYELCVAGDYTPEKTAATIRLLRMEEIYEHTSTASSSPPAAT